MKDKEQIALFFKTDFPLNKEGVEELISLFKMKKYPKNTFLLQEDDFERKLRFVNKGVIREFYRAGKKEINIIFFTTPQFITDFSSFIQNSRTNKNQEALSSVQILELGEQKFVHLLD